MSHVFFFFWRMLYDVFRSTIRSKGGQSFKLDPNKNVINFFFSQDDRERWSEQ